ncbi:hypothetical protein [Arthrobacter sp. H14]|uniref:hypothetical protein n=1 Tax=Arthrobacter sp. H14 TaxID=1312959 RepID=UPI0012DDC709|nr:hypothetical protein [Arthrobacter sp. H14]
MPGLAGTLDPELQQPETAPSDAPPADYNAASATIYMDAYYDQWWDDDTVMDAATNKGAWFGFDIKDSGTRVTSQDNHEVVFSASGDDIGVNTTTTLFSTSNGGTWYTTVTAKEGGFTEGTANITAKVTNLTTNEVSYKT